MNLHPLSFLFCTMRLIRASEIGEHVFCRRAWWLRHIQGRASANVQELASGAAIHAGHGKLVWLSSALLTLAALLIVIAILITLISLTSNL
jgi:hypothetical protein